MDDFVEKATALMNIAYEAGKNHVLKYGAWVPCEVRLPDEEGAYLVTRYSDGEYEVLEKTFLITKEFPRGTWGFGSSCIIAWMPYPKPYVG